MAGTIFNAQWNFDILLAVSTTSTSIGREHIAEDPNIFGGKPCVAGTRIRVQDIYIWHELQNQSADEIVASFPQLTHAGVYAALTYFWDHRDAMLAEMHRDDRLIEEMKKQYVSKLRDGK